MTVQKAVLIATKTDLLSERDIWKESATPKTGTDVFIRANSIGLRDWKCAGGKYLKIWTALSSDPSPLLVPTDILKFTNEFIEI